MNADETKRLLECVKEEMATGTPENVIVDVANEVVNETNASEAEGKRKSVLFEPLSLLIKQWHALGNFRETLTLIRYICHRVPYHSETFSGTLDLAVDAARKELAAGNIDNALMAVRLPEGKLVDFVGLPSSEFRIARMPWPDSPKGEHCETHGAYSQAAAVAYDIAQAALKKGALEQAHTACTIVKDYLPYPSPLCLNAQQIIDKISYRLCTPLNEAWDDATRENNERLQAEDQEDKERAVAAFMRDPSLGACEL